MSFGLARGRQLDPGGVGVVSADLPPVPDDPAERERARFDPRGWFADPGLPFEIEIGSGKGGFLVESATARPGVNLLGIEWAKEFWRYTADRCRRHGLANVRVLHADAVEFLKWRIAEGVADVIHLYYSDPWPKTRHHKRRVVRDEFLAEARRVLRTGGQLRIVTDHDGYWEWMQDHFARWCKEEARAPDSGTGVPISGTGVSPVREINSGMAVPPAVASLFPWEMAGVRDARTESPLSSKAPGSESRATTGGFIRLSDADAAAAIRSATAPGVGADLCSSERGPASLVRTNYERKFTSEAKPPHAAVLVSSRA